VGHGGRLGDARHRQGRSGGQAPMRTRRRVGLRSDAYGDDAAAAAAVDRTLSTLLGDAPLQRIYVGKRPEVHADGYSMSWLLPAGSGTGPKRKPTASIPPQSEKAVSIALAKVLRGTRPLTTVSRR